MRNRKRAASITAGVLAAAILLTGTFAWRSISQQAKNEIIHSVNPGGRLHDDFDGENKDVYVENFMSAAEGGQPIFARVRLDEYLEFGPDAGKNRTSGSRNITKAVAGTDINDVTTWIPHIPDPNDVTACKDPTANPFHNYWAWEMGGETVFMPTFNKNRDSLSADINGTWDGKNPNDNVNFDDYHAYTLGETKTADAYYDADDTDADDEYFTQGLGKPDGSGGTVNVDYTAVNETHTAKKTQKSTVITMAAWKAMGCPMGPMWVYDVDGWAYWAQAIEPGEATGLLLDGIEYVGDATEGSDPTYYAINVVGQFSTSGDWGDKDSKDGFYDPVYTITDDAQLLLNEAAGLNYTSVTVAEKNNTVTAAPGAVLEYKADVKCATDAQTTPVKVPGTWSVSGASDAKTTVDADGKLTLGADEANGTVLTVQYKTWNRITAQATVTVDTSLAAGGKSAPARTLAAAPATGSKTDG